MVLLHNKEDMVLLHQTWAMAVLLLQTWAMAVLLHQTWDSLLVLVVHLDITKCNVVIWFCKTDEFSYFPFISFAC